MSTGAQVHADPPIGQKQRRPMDGAQFHSPWVGFAGGGLVSRPCDLVITLGPARAGTPALQPAWRPALHSGQEAGATFRSGGRRYIPVRRPALHSGQEAGATFPPIGQKQRRPMDGAQFHSRWVVQFHSRWVAQFHFSWVAQFHSPWVGFAGGGLKWG
jgi:hypothetical protein